MHARYRDALAGHALPAAFVDLQALRANIATLGALAGGLPVRLVTKSVRSVGMLRLLLAEAPYLRGLMCFAPAEAAWLASLGFDDLLVAYPSVDPAGLRAVAAQCREGRRIVLMVDHAAQLPALELAARHEGATLAVAIDLDVSTDFPGLRFGVWRSPVDGPRAALALAEAIRRHSGLRLEGLMGYEGQIAGLADALPGQALRNAAVRWLQRRSNAALQARRQATVEALRRAGFALAFVNGGGSGSLARTRQDRSVTELAAGSGFYAPALFDHYQGLRLQPAAGFALPVTRLPKPGLATCSGGGYVASGPAGRDRLPVPWLPDGLRLLAHEGAGEVQTPLQLPPGGTLAIGEPVCFRHAKAGELCERFDELLLLDDGRVVDALPTYRGDGRCFF